MQEKEDRVRAALTSGQWLHKCEVPMRGRHVVG